MHQGAFIERQIMAEKLPRLMARIDKINEKLKSGALPLIAVEYGAAQIRAVNIPGNGIASLPMIDVRIAREADSPSAGFAQLLAKTTIDSSLGTSAMQHRTYGELTAEQRQLVQDPPNPAACDHCTSNRNRAYIFTLNTPGGLMRVGGGCLKDFMGFDMARWAGALNEVIEETDRVAQISFSEVNEHEVIPIRMFLGEAITHIAKHGYHKRETGAPTGEMAFELCQALVCENVDAEPPELSQRVSQVIDYIKDSENRSEDKHKDYFVNLRTMVEVGYLTRRQSNLIASAVASLQRHEAELAKKDEYKGVGLNFIGQPKERLLLKNLKLEAVIPGSNNYGSTTTFKMIDDAGNLFQWKATGVFDIEAGGTINLVGTVKHEEFYSSWYRKVVLYNTLSRCQILTPEEVLEFETKKPRKKSAASMDNSPSP